MRLHRLTIERAGVRERPVVLAACRAAKADYEKLRAHVLSDGVLPRSGGAGWPGSPARRPASRCSPGS